MEVSIPSRAVVGLGNPGEEYARTRHNLGFWVVDELARRWTLSLREGACHSRLGRGERALLVQPLTYMNRSGYTIRCLAEKWGYRAADLLVVFDDVDLPLGTLRLRSAGGPGGHRGLESVIENLRTTEVARLRLGIRPAAGDDGDLSDFVLAPFGSDEEELATLAVERAADACECWLDEGAERAMSLFNGAISTVAEERAEKS